MYIIEYTRGFYGEYTIGAKLYTYYVTFPKSKTYRLECTEECMMNLESIWEKAGYTSKRTEDKDYTK